MNTIYTTLYTHTLQYAHALYDNKVNNNLYTDATLITIQNEAKPRFVFNRNGMENHDITSRITTSKIK